jgi:hypothetical protein
MKKELCIGLDVHKDSITVAAAQGGREGEVRLYGTLCLSVRVHVRLFFEPGDEHAGSFQCHVEIIDAEKQKESIAGRRLIRAHQRRMLVRTPLVETKQDGSIRIEYLPKVVMARRRLGLAKERLNHLKLPGTSLTPMITHVRFMTLLRSA